MKGSYNVNNRTMRDAKMMGWFERNVIIHRWWMRIVRWRRNDGSLPVRHYGIWSRVYRNGLSHVDVYAMVQNCVVSLPDCSKSARTSDSCLMSERGDEDAEKEKRLEKESMSRVSRGWKTE